MRAMSFRVRDDEHTLKWIQKMPDGELIINNQLNIQSMASLSQTLALLSGSTFISCMSTLFQDRVSQLIKGPFSYMLLQLDTSRFRVRPSAALRSWRTLVLM